MRNCPMSSATASCVDGRPSLLLVEPRAAHSVRAAQLSQQRYSVTETDCALEIFLMHETLQFSIAVLDDQIGTLFLCSAAASVRGQWPTARILILGRVPPAMNDQLYDDVVVHSVDANTLLATIDKLAEDPWKNTEALPAYLRCRGATVYTGSAPELRESDPTKVAAIAAEVDDAHDLPADQHRSHRRGHYAFPPAI